MEKDREIIFKTEAKTNRRKMQRIKNRKRRGNVFGLGNMFLNAQLRPVRRGFKQYYGSSFLFLNLASIFPSDIHVIYIHKEHFVHSFLNHT